MDVYYGSQTGTAEGFSRLLAEEAKKKGFDASVIDLADFRAEKLKTSKLAIFVVATQGDGDPTDNAELLHKWLQNESNTITSDYLNNVAYAVFGCGNKTYENFNKMGKFVDTQLELIGGHRIVSVGLGDDDDCIEGDFEKWREILWRELTLTCLGEEDVNMANQKEEIIGNESVSKSTENLSNSIGVPTSLAAV